MTKNSRQLGCMLGLAIGDALVYPVEFQAPPERLGHDVAALFRRRELLHDPLVEPRSDRCQGIPEKLMWIGLPPTVPSTEAEKLVMIPVAG